MISKDELSSQKLASMSKLGRYKYRINVYQQTKKLVDEGFYQNSNGERVAILDGEAEDSLQRTVKIVSFRGIEERTQNRWDTVVSVVDSDCLDTAIYMKRLGYRPVVLNMANNTNPGGGVDYGAGAQEESLFRRSNYFQHLSKRLYPIDHGIYSPNVAYFRASEAEEYALLDRPENISMIAAAALRGPRLVKENGQYRLNPQDRAIMRDKIRLILDIAERFEHDCVVLSAFGCGAFKNPPEDIAEIFREVVLGEEFRGVFKRVVFAIFNDHNARHEYAPDGNVIPFARAFATDIVYSFESIN